MRPPTRKSAAPVRTFLRSIEARRHLTKVFRVHQVTLGIARFGEHGPSCAMIVSAYSILVSASSLDYNGVLDTFVSGCATKIYLTAEKPSFCPRSALHENRTESARPSR